MCMHITESCGIVSSTTRFFQWMEWRVIEPVVIDLKLLQKTCPFPTETETYSWELFFVGLSQLVMSRCLIIWELNYMSSRNVPMFLLLRGRELRQFEYTTQSHKQSVAKYVS